MLTRILTSAIWQTVATFIAISAALIGFFTYVRSSKSRKEKIAVVASITLASLLIITTIGWFISTTLPGDSYSQATLSTHPQSGTILYRADFTHGIGTWSGPSDWKSVANMLVNDGTGSSNYRNSVVLAPCQLNTANYVVETTIQYLRGGGGFGILARGGGGNGYKAWISAGGIAAITLASQSPTGHFMANDLVEQDYQLDTAWHTYRFDINENRLTFFIDGQKIPDTQDAHYLNPGRVGLAVYGGSQINIKSFQVTAL